MLDLLIGAVHFFSRIPRGLKVATPFVNGIVEGTEFLVKVERNQTFFSIFEGRVAATNEAGSLTLTSGQSAIAQAGQAPALRIVVRPRDAVQWALYYPPILDYRPVDFPGGAPTDWQSMVRKSIGFYWEGDLARAFSGLEGVPEDIPDPRFFAYRAALLLSVGRVDEAGVDIERALILDPRNSHAFALQSIIAVAQNEKERALDLARKAAELDPESPAARVALSYAQQAYFDLKGSLTSLQEAVKLDPENALAWGRLAELWLSLGYLERALKAAQEAVALNPNLERTQTVLGFAYLTQIKIRDAKNAFEKAIELDQAAPLPRLGLGLAKVREGHLKAGRGEIEIAVSLDPNNALIRSYLGKAYFEEKRDKLVRDQFAISKELDPLDPTPWFYDAIRKQTTNRPVEALQDLQKSIELNDNRAIYRSRLLLDEDLAARSASLARIYSDLGFQQLALVEGWKSVNTDPGNYSAHRFLADSYAALPRHEIARVSELLQSQLLQPINITPVRPQLAESNLFILEGAGPAAPSFNEFNPLFHRNRFALQANCVLGENETLGDELVHSAVWGKVSYSLGQFHYETDGFRENNDLEQDIYNVFAQVSPWHKTSILAELRYKDREEGDLPLRFDLDGQENFAPNRRIEGDSTHLRIGLRHSFSPRSDIIAHLTYLDAEEEARDKTAFTTVDISVEDEGYMAEGQHLFRSELLDLTSGIGHFSADREESVLISLILPPMPLSDSLTEPDILHTNFYVYAN
ncbi:MAG: tetratricopeptide repeat protein, partial [Hadesarchaea archaeon]|nr:tetratricopeptide repeat protein [Hadesarchaea archaeon]